MGCNNSKVKEEDKEPPSLSDQYADIIPFDEVGGDFSGDSTMFYEDIHDVEKSVPYLKAHPNLEITVEVYLDCPKECTKQRCGHCTTDQCNNTSIADEQVQIIESILARHDCPNGVNRKFWGCRDDTINKDIIKIFISEKEKEKEVTVETVTVPVPFVVDTHAIDEENAKKEAAFAQLEAALLAKEALLAKKMAADDNEKQAIAEENAKRNAAFAQQEAALLASEALLAKKLAAVEKDRDEVAEEKKRLLDTKKQLQAVEDEQEEMRIANETATQEAERRRLAYEKAQHNAEEKTKEAEKALLLADQKKKEYEIALVAVAKERQEESDKVKAIMYDIEETLKEEIEFVQNKAELTDQGKVICNKVLPFLLKLPDMKIHVESHTNCKKGKCDKGCHLMDLSQDRVDTVKRYFVEHGSTNEFQTKGWGCRHPELKNVRMVRIYPDHSHHETIHVNTPQ